jgi:hypothetical protein
MKLEIDAFALIAGGAFYILFKFVVNRAWCRREEKDGVKRSSKHKSDQFDVHMHRKDLDADRIISNGFEAMHEIEAAEPEAECALDAASERTPKLMSLTHSAVFVLVSVIAMLSMAIFFPQYLPHAVSLNEDTKELDLPAEHIAIVEKTGKVQRTLGKSKEAPQKLDAPQIRIPLTRQKVVENIVENAVVEYRSAYYGTLNLGSNMDGYTFIFDTGSGHLIVPSMYCHSAACKKHKRYKRSASVTASDIDGMGRPVDPKGGRETITVEFGSGEVSGAFTDDAVCVGRNEPIARHQATEETLPRGCTRLRFITTTEMSENPFASFPFDGILGLGMPSLSQTPEFNFINALSEQMKMPKVFGLFLARDPGATSELSLGGWDPKHVDLKGETDVNWFPVAHDEMGHWLVKIKSLRVDNDNVDFCADDCYVVVDSGTALLSVPTVSFKNIYAQLWHYAGLEGECRGTGPELHFDFEGETNFTITMGPEDYARPQRSSSTSKAPQYGPTIMGELDKRNDFFCRPLLMAMDMPAPVPPKLFILGEPVLRKYYTAYDVESKRVAFGPASHPASQPSSSDTSAADMDLDIDEWFFD